MRKHTDRHSIRPENPKYFLCDVTIGGENKKNIVHLHFKKCLF